MSTPDNSRSFLGKCKSCKRIVQASAISEETRPTQRDRNDRVTAPMRKSWLVLGGALHGHRTVLEAAWNGRWQMAVACPGCRTRVILTAVKGTFSAEHLCGAKCLASKGPNCECSCGGRNHGRSHSA